MSLTKLQRMALERIAILSSNPTYPVFEAQLQNKELGSPARIDTPLGKVADACCEINRWANAILEP